MSQIESVLEAGYVLTLEEIASLTEESGKPAETLMNVVALIARRFHTDVCSAYLLEPDRANLVLAATVGLRPQCIGTLRMALQEGLVGLVAEASAPRGRGAGARTIRASSTFRRPARMRTNPSSEFRSLIEAFCRACWWCKPSRPGSFAEDEIRMLAEAAAAGGAGGQRSPHARPLHRARAGAALVAGPQSVVELGPGLQQPVPRPRSGPLAATQSQSHLAAGGDSAWRKIERRAGELVLHSRINYAYRRQREYLAGRPHLGREACRHFAAPSGGLFLGGVRAARIHPDLFRRSGRPGRRSHQERVRPGHSAGRRRLVLWPGIFPAAPGSKRLAAGRIPADGRQPVAHGTGHRDKGRTGHRADRNARRLPFGRRSGA